MKKNPPSIEEKIVSVARKFATSVGVSDHKRDRPRPFLARLFGFPPQQETYMIVTVHVSPSTQIASETGDFGAAIDRISVEHNVQIQWTIQACAFSAPRARSRAA